MGELGSPQLFHRTIWRLELEPREGDLVLDILRGEMGTLRRQGYHSEAPAFRDRLKQRETLLRGAISRLAGLDAGASQ